ncbi:DUF3168 domain-containing protein [Aureimonas sp. AU20]|uniref:DUF3168 domain-containing protein n=1 Tax=Aureimonas sp. AU20 TaxID=1349819 RepID=UPI000B11F4F8|nr:DUF3168 domain-containing protein [Aureimonas sp. AU20]
MTAITPREAIEAAYAVLPADPALALQAAIRERLLSSPIMGAIFAPMAIVDGPRHPNMFPSITFGTPQTIANDLTLARRHATIALDLHIWTREEASVEASKLAGIVRSALFASPLTSPEISFADVRYQGTRILRDSSSQHGHAVVSVEAIARWRQ